MARRRLPVVAVVSILVAMIGAAPGRTDQTKHLGYTGPYHGAFVNPYYDAIPANTANAVVTAHDQNIPQISLHYEFYFHSYQARYICVDPDPYNCLYVTVDDYDLISSGDFCQTSTLAVPAAANRFRVYPTIDPACGPVPTTGTIELTYVTRTT